ncbi:MAG: hypothetical protein LIO65_01530 [Odoribacter sp.]|nr:hypothetical protein [Odoribacter sp.]
MEENNIKVLSYYQERGAFYQDKHKETSRLRNYLTIAKVVSFVAIGYILYRFAVKGEWIILGVGAVFVLFFIGLTLWDNQVVRKLRKYEEIIKDCEAEIAYLTGDYKNLRTGSGYFLQSILMLMIWIFWDRIRCLCI